MLGGQEMIHSFIPASEHPRVHWAWLSYGMLYFSPSVPPATLLISTVALLHISSQEEFAMDLN